MIYCTGDLHGDRARLAKGPARKLKRGDTLIVCGDFGFLWNGGPEEQKILDWIGRRRWTTLFVEGTHDNLDLLAQYPREELGGAPAHHLGGRLWHLIRGEIYTLEGRTFLAMGGGESDGDTRGEPGENWWPGELPRQEELPAYRSILEDRGRRVDYIVSHQAPTNIESCLGRAPGEVNLLTAYLDELQRVCSFDRWFFGCYHQNKVIPPKYYALYDKVQEV